jgi:hypothetical protein
LFECGGEMIGRRRQAPVGEVRAELLVERRLAHVAPPRARRTR